MKVKFSSFAALFFVVVLCGTFSFASATPIPIRFARVAADPDVFLRFSFGDGTTGYADLTTIDQLNGSFWATGVRSSA